MWRQPALATSRRSDHSDIPMRFHRYWVSSLAPWLRVIVATACIVNGLVPQTAMAMAMRRSGLDKGVLATAAHPPACHGADSKVTTPAEKSMPGEMSCCAQGLCQCGVPSAFTVPSIGANSLAYVVHSPLAVGPASSAAPHDPAIPLLRPPIP